MKIGIRDKIILIMLVVIIISITSIGILTFNNAKAIILNEVKQSSFKTLENANDYFLRRFMSDMEHVVNYWAEDEEIISYRNKPSQPKMVRSIPSHFQDIADQWMGYIKGSPYIAWLYLGPEEDGSLFIAPLDTTMPEDYDCRTRDWYKKAVENKGKAVWTDPYLDAGEIGGMVVTVAREVESQSGISGAVGLDIKLSRI
ncbi:MAG: cache domain-containing protein, partial [Lutispora sp.]|nr:cache domain-containing protein [Lutispora sp.]